MPKYVIERQYLVPMYQHIVVEADNFEGPGKAASSPSNQSSREAPAGDYRSSSVPQAKFPQFGTAGLLTLRWRKTDSNLYGAFRVK